MENEIKVGEYVRTDNGIIGKYVKYRGIEDRIETNNKWIGFDIEKDIVKHSPNLIDLVEEGDYINGEEVDKIRENEEEGKYIRTLFLNIYKNWEIEDIVTHEQFESISYKVERKQTNEL